MKKFFRIAVAFFFSTLIVVLAEGIHGSASLNDPLYPWMGNGGYDSQDYEITLRVSDDHKTIVGATTMTATATEDLISFNLDLGSLEVKTVLVDGASATFDHQDPELTITPAKQISKGQKFSVTVQYAGVPGSKVGTGVEIGGNGWTPTSTGVMALAEPSALMNWAAVNDSPADKATFGFVLTAPSKDKAIANGIFLGRTENSDGTATSRYRIDTPTTSYMPTIAFGNYELVEGGVVDGVRIRHYLAPDTAKYYKPVLEKTGAMIQLFSKLFGTYPFKEYGIITHNVELSFALETQTLSSFPTDFGYPENFPKDALQTEMEEVYAHELVHQWFGALVSFKDNSQVFIHEGFAQYFGEYWNEEHGGPKIADRIKDSYAGFLYAKDGGYFTNSKDQYVALIKGNFFNIDPKFVYMPENIAKALDIIFSGSLPKDLREKFLSESQQGLTIAQLADKIATLPFTEINVTRTSNRELRRIANPDLPKVAPMPPPGKIMFGDDLFNGNVYDRGAAAVHALRLKTGDETFFKILRAFLDRYRFATASNQDFLAVVKEIAGDDAANLMGRWLFDERVPDFPELGLKASEVPALGANFK